MTASILTRTGRRSALVLTLAALTLPGIALAEPGGEDRGGWRGRGGDNEAVGNIGAGGWQRPAPAPQPEAVRIDNGGGGGGGGWSRPQMSTPPPPPAPIPQAAPAPSANWSGDHGQRGGWNGGNGGGWSGGQRGGGDGWSGGNQWQSRDRNRDHDGDRNRDHDGDRNRDHDGDRNRAWNGNQGWSGNRDWNRNRDRDHDGDRWRGNDWGRGNSWNGSRYSYNNDYRRWDHRWRSNNRYDWGSYRHSHSDLYRLRPYYSPYRGYSYRRLSIGFFLDSLFFSQSYWINDPWQYRLPDAYGPYRWVRYYDDALLVNTYTGEVVDVIYSFFW